jgi:hypothetical protein
VIRTEPHFIDLIRPAINSNDIGIVGRSFGLCRFGNLGRPRTSVACTGGPGRVS